MSIRVIDEPIVITAGRNGPPSSGHGGWTAGLLARHLPGPASVALRAMPPLDTPLTVIEEGSAVRLVHGDTLIAEARPAAPIVSPPRAVTWGEATAARATYLHAVDGRHPFPTCFGCGPDRDPRDALCLYAGSIPTSGLVAAPWDVRDVCHQGAVTAELMWAALDCPTGAAIMASADYDASRQPVVLANLAVRVEDLPRLGDRCIVTAWPMGHQGRKWTTCGMVRSADGTILAVAEALWIELRAPTR